MYNPNDDLSMLEVVGPPVIQDAVRRLRQYIHLVDAALHRRHPRRADRIYTLDPPPEVVNARIPPNQARYVRTRVDGGLRQYGGNLLRTPPGQIRTSDGLDIALVNVRWTRIPVRLDDTPYMQLSVYCMEER